MTQRKASASVTVHYITAPEKGDPGEPGEPGKDGEDGKDGMTRYVLYCVSADVPGMYPRPLGGGMYDMSELYLKKDAATAGTASLRWSDTEPSPDEQGEGESVYRIDCTVPVSFGWVTDDLGESPWSAPAVWRRPPAVEVRVECDTAAVLKTGSGTYLPETIKFRGYKRVGTRAWEDCADDSVWFLSIPRAAGGWYAMPASTAVKGVSWKWFVAENSAPTAFEADVLSPSSGERYGSISLPVVSDGPEGCVVRTRDWASGCVFEDGTAVSSDGVRYIDIALTREGSARYWWRCVKRHTSTPGAAAENNLTGYPEHSKANTYWIAINDVGPIYSALVLAPEARIDFLDGQEILISEDETVWGRMGCPTANGYIMWTGGATPGTPNDGGGTWSVDREGLSRWSNGVNSIFLNPSTARLEYWSSGELVTVFEGNRYEGPAALRASDIAEIATRTEPTLMSGITSKGAVSVQAHHRDLGTVRVKETCNAVVRANVGYRLTAVGASVTAGGGAWGCGIGVFALSLLDIDGNEVARSTETTLRGDSVPSPTGTLEMQLTVSGLAPGTYTVRADCLLSIQVYGTQPGTTATLDTYVYAQRQFSGDVRDLTVTASADARYLAQYYANGMAIATSASDYAMIWEQDSHISLEVFASGTYGLRVNRNGIYVANATGQWLTFKEEVERILRVKGLID